jgi:hypothetical protein
MKWVLPSYTEGREKFLVRERENIEELRRTYENLPASAP